MQVSLLDIPDVILERILFSLAFGEDRGDRYSHPAYLPLNVIPLSSTCKKFRRLASTLLTDDTQWRANAARSRSLMSIPFFDFNDDLTDVCAHLSNDVDAPISCPDPERCGKRPCGFIHRQIVWYQLAAPSIKSFDLFTVSQKLPKREAFRIFDCFREKHAPIEEFNMKHSWIHTTTSVERYVESLEYVLPFTASNLKTLHVTLFDRPAIGQVLSQNSLTSLKTLRIYSTTDHEEYDVDMICTHLSQLSQSGTRLEQLELHGEAFHAEDLPRILAVCPYVHDLVLINFDLSDSSFPAYQQLSQFQIRKLTLGCRISEENLQRIAEFIVNSHHGCELHFDESEIPSISNTLETHKLEFGSRIKTFVLHSRPEGEHDADAVRNIAAYCPNIESFDISIGNSEAFSPLGEFLIRARSLKHITVRTQKIRGLEGNSEVTKFIESARIATCPVETIELDLVLPTSDEVCKLIGSFANSLRYFRLRRFFPLRNQKQHPFGIIEDTVKVIRFLERGYNFPNLKSISLPVPNTDHLDDDEELLLREITCLLNKLEIKIKNFDSGEMIRKLADHGP